MNSSKFFGLSLVAGVCLGAVAFWGITRDTRPVLVCLGDSLTSCGGQDGKYSHHLQRMLPHVRVINAGIGGDTLEGARKRYRKDVLKKHPDVVLVALGANDFWRRRRPVSAMRDDLVTMVSDFQKAGAKVIVAGCFGERDLWGEHSVEFDCTRFGLAWHFAQMEKEVVCEYNCRYLPNMQIDVKPNRLKPYWDMTDHPNSAGNEQIAMRLLPLIKSALRES
jgi:lysophospholipase L1-like esterase